ncbi:MAG: ATP-binding protein [Bdellovibrionota bacterium]|nr:ATP-binding protein [Bdellovibrionota bacterium]
MASTKKNTSIATKIIFYIILSSFLVSSVGTFISLKRNYEKYKKDIHKRFMEIEKTLLPPLASALYSEDTGQIKNGINGILNAPDIVYVEIKDPEGKRILYKSGIPQKRNSIAKSLRVHYTEDDDESEYIADLKMTASLQGATKKIKDQIIVFALIQGGQFFILTILIFYIFTRIISKPLAKMSSYAENINLNDLSEELLDLKRKTNVEDELDKVTNSLNKMKTNLITSHNKLKDYAENLEEKVKEKTFELETEKIEVEMLAQHHYEQKKARDELLGSLDQGYLTFNRDGIIHHGTTKITEELLETSLFESEVEKLKIWDVLFEDKERRANFEKWVNKVFEGMISFKDLVQLAPKRFQGKSEKYIQLDFRPIFQEDSKRLIDKIIMIASDKSKEMQLKKQLEVDKENTYFVKKCLQNPVEFVDLIFDSTEVIQNYQYENTNANKEELFRQFHTLKARYGQFHLKNLSETINQIETSISNNNFNDITSNVEKFQKSLQEFLKKNRLIVEAANKFLVDEGTSAPISEIIQKAKEYKVDSSFLIFLKNNYLLSDIKTKFERYTDLVHELAEKQGKKINVEISGDTILVNSNKYRDFINASIHLFRNMVDHGIESVDERIEKAKPQQGSIKVKFKINGQAFEMTMKDDGQGIDPKIIKDKVIEKKLKNHQDLKGSKDSELIEMIFLPGFSTKEDVTEVSGRGVGMDAVKDEVKKLSGEISVSSKIDEGTTFSIKLPILN